VLAHNLAREVQMISREPTHQTEKKQPAHWDFMQLNTIHQRIVQRAGRLIRPQGKLTLSMSANAPAQDELLQILEAIDRAA